MALIRVLLVDDHPIARLGIRNLLQQASDIAIVGEAKDGVEALSMVKELSPDVIVLDMEMPRLTGTQVAQQLKEDAMPVHILALSAYNDVQYIQGLLNQGAAGYLVKEEVPESIVDAVRGVARGEQGWVSRSVAVKLTTIVKDTKKSGLTKREMEVLRRLVAGKTNQEIGLDMGISNRTVEKYLQAVYKKLGVHSRVDAAVIAAREGWA